MASKCFVVLAALMAVVHSSVVGELNDYSSFSYDVADPLTGDYKSQVETRVGGAVQGQYSLLDADGTKRTVDYAADDVNGFNAVVRKDAAVVSSPIVAAAPGVIAARTVAAPPVVAARAVAAPAVYASGSSVLARTIAAPSVVAAAPALYSASPAVVAARTVAAPSYITASSPSVVAARTIAAPGLIASAPAVVSARTVAAPGLYASAPSVVAAPALAGRAIYAASAPTLVAARTIAAPGLVAQSVATPSVYNSLSNGQAVVAGVASPYSYASYSAPVSTW